MIQNAKLIDHVNEIIAKPGPHNLRQIIWDYTKDFVYVRMYMDMFCEYRLAIPGTFFKTNGGITGASTRMPSIIAGIDDKTNYLHSLVLIVGRGDGSQDQEEMFVFYISDKTIAFLLHITYGFRLITKDDEMIYKW